MELHFLSPMEESTLTEFTGLINLGFPDTFSKNNEYKFVIVSPQMNLNGNSLDLFSDSRWDDISRAWFQINNSTLGAQLKAWRTIHAHGEEIAPNMRVFRLKDSKYPTLFWLSPETDIRETLARFADLLPKISSYWHILSGRGLFHAAGILHKKQVFLFLGVSGAGKSTVSRLSAMLGDKIIHDDHVVLYRGETGRWMVTDSTYLSKGFPLKALFFLIQDNKDELQIIKSATSATGLFESLKEHGKQVLFGEVLKQAFTLSSDIARDIPGFRLRFRKSPDFWKLIDAEFPGE